MKTNFTFSIVLLFISLTGFAQTTANCPSFFRRNNGNGSCPDGQLKLYFTNCPAVPPAIDSVYTNGIKQNISFSTPDASKCNSQGYIGYCVAGGNMPPTSTWQIFFHGAAFSDAYGCSVPEGGPLPVKYFSINAVVANGTVLISWVTDFELNNDHFEVERSFDGVSFETAGLVLDGFENGIKKSYQFKDLNQSLLSKTVVYYRLKQVDNNGRYIYSDVIVVKLQAKTGVIMQTAPNPFTTTLNIGFTSNEAGKAQINVIDVTGQKVFSEEATLNKGYNALQLKNIGKITPGIYVAQLIINGNMAASQKIIKN